MDDRRRTCQRGNGTDEPLSKPAGQYPILNGHQGRGGCGLLHESLGNGFGESGIDDPRMNSLPCKDLRGKERATHRLPQGNDGDVGSGMKLLIVSDVNGRGFIRGFGGDRDGSTTRKPDGEWPVEPHGGCEHALTFPGCTRSGDDHVRNAPKVRKIEHSVMGRTVFTRNPRAVQNERDGGLVQRSVADYLIKGTLEE